MNETRKSDHPQSSEKDMQAPTEPSFPTLLRSHADFVRDCYSVMLGAEAQVVMASLQRAAWRIEELERALRAECELADLKRQRAESAEKSLAEAYERAAKVCDPVGMSAMQIARIENSVILRDVEQARALRHSLAAAIRALKTGEKADG